ncbi:NAD-dependent epimerase/dehydratase family protein [Paracoccus sp. (in: a-proteobacteria)]|uniref:NAD-dependent epimerase/dehydratase family protein n=1 Tax=Paracoccus sp. TaxID=267 RepID=UPI00396CB233
MTESPQKLLVTGGAGFIGSHLSNALLAEGHQVVILDDLSSGFSGNVPPSAQFVQASVTDAAAVAAAATDCDAIFHLAALVSVPECISDWTGGHRVNIGGTINVMQASRMQGNIPVIYASSAAVYGDQTKDLCHEDDRPAPLSPYGADKLACEHHASAFWHVHGLPSMGLRFFNVYGPGQSITSPYAGVIARFCENARSGQPHAIFGDGLQTRDFVHVSDVVAILIRSLDLLFLQPQALVSNVCSNSATSLLDLTAELGRIIPGSDRDIRFLPARKGDIRLSRGDDARMKRLFGHNRTLPLSQGLATLFATLPHQGARNPA